MREHGQSPRETIRPTRWKTRCFLMDVEHYGIELEIHLIVNYANKGTYEICAWGKMEIRQRECRTFVTHCVPLNSTLYCAEVSHGPWKIHAYTIDKIWRGNYTRTPSTKYHGDSTFVHHRPIVILVIGWAIKTSLHIIMCTNMCIQIGTRRQIIIY